MCKLPRSARTAGLPRMMVLVFLVLGAPVGCRPQPGQPKTEPPLRADGGDASRPQVATSHAPLSLDSNEAARLLGGGDATPTRSAAAAKLNSRCHVCHANYAQEELAVTHARAKVGCEECHGPSNEHCSDEDNITPPMVLFPREKIVPSCLKCHVQDKLAGVDKHKPAMTAAGKWEKICTDCHGSHRVKVRTRRWDKETGQLISDDGVRMIRKPKPPSSAEH